MSPAQPFVKNHPVSLRLAKLADVSELSSLEESTFAGDRISKRSWRSLVESSSATVTLIREATAPRSLVAAAVVLRRKRSSVARLYSIAVAPAARGTGLAGVLLDDAIARSREAGSAAMRLETRAKNTRAQRFFKDRGFVPLDRKASYYEDGADALRFQKSLWHQGSARGDAALRTPYYGQTLDFTCGPCAVLMAMAALDRQTVLTRAAEIRIWREATTVFMAAGHGGCGPLGLALAAVRRGFHATVYAPSVQTMFIDSVRDPRKKEVIALVEADFRIELASTHAEIVSESVSPARLAEHLEAGGVPVVLISLWRLHGEKGPHWVVVAGFDGHVFRILDPMVAPTPGDPGLAVSVEEFRRMSRYGRRRHTAAVIISNDFRSGL
jgi:ribosomal protein S18 acetylase RimI-like enzyme